MLEMKLRSTAGRLLESAIRFAPPHVRDWGRAMMGELSHVEGTWAPTLWALGSSSVLAKHALLNLFTPGRSQQDFSTQGGLSTEEFSIGKATLITAGGCILAALLMFAAPAFRQAFQLSLAPWHWVFKLSPPDDQSGLRDLARRAEDRHDAEGLAFCAERIRDDGESVRLADEAVRLDPSLLWIYAVVALHHPRLPVVSQWIPKLEQWNPQNGLFYMITAENTGFLQEGRKDAQQGLARNPVRLKAMAAAFGATEFDDYVDRLEALDCKVLPRYGLSNPDQVTSGAPAGIPFKDSRDYARLLVQSGMSLEVRGDRAGAKEKYWRVVHFGQLIDFEGHSRQAHVNGDIIQSYAYEQLQAVSEREGNRVEAAHFAYVSMQLDPRRAPPPAWSTGQDVARWNAREVTTFGLLMLIFAASLGFAGSIFVLRRRGKGPNALRAKRMASKFVLVGAVGSFLSSGMLYITYHPYAIIMERIVNCKKPVGYEEVLDRVLKGDKSGPYAETLDHFLKSQGRGVEAYRIFLTDTDYLPFAPASEFGRFYLPSRTLYAVFYFWMAVTVSGLMGLLFVAIRRFRRPLPPSAPV